MISLDSPKTTALFPSALAMKELHERDRSRGMKKTGGKVTAFILLQAGFIRSGLMRKRLMMRRILNLLRTEKATPQPMINLL